MFYSRTPEDGFWISLSGLLLLAVFWYRRKQSKAFLHQIDLFKNQKKAA